MLQLLKLAARNLRRNRRRTLITLAALIFGVMVMVSLRGFINGMQNMIIENLVYGQAGAIQIHKAGYFENVLSSPLTLDMEDTPEVRQKILSVKGVTALAPRVQFGAMLSTPDKPLPEGETRELREDEKGKTSFFLATGIDPDAEQKVVPKRTTWLKHGGQMFASASDDQLVLNADFAKGMDAKVIQKSSRPEDVAQWPALLAADRDGSLNGANVTVSGELLSVIPGDRKYGFVPLKTAQSVLHMENRVTEYALGVDPKADLGKVKSELQAALGPAYDVKTWDEILPFIKELTGTQDKVFGIITNIFLFVVLLGIVNAMLMSVLERVREIGTMLAVGMRRRQITLLFLFEGAVLGILGGAIGVLFGALIVTALNHKGVPLPAPGATTESIVRPFVPMLYLVRTLLFATVGASLAALWPAWRASRLRPVEALAST